MYSPNAFDNYGIAELEICVVCHKEQMPAVLNEFMDCLGSVDCEVLDDGAEAVNRLEFIGEVPIPFVTSGELNALIDSVRILSEPWIDGVDPILYADLHFRLGYTTAEDYSVQDSMTEQHNGPFSNARLWAYNWNICRRKYDYRSTSRKNGDRIKMNDPIDAERTLRWMFSYHEWGNGKNKNKR